MGYNLKDVVYETINHWVLRGANGTYEVYESHITHSTRCAIISFKGQKGLDKAITECDKRTFARLKVALNGLFNRRVASGYIGSFNQLLGDLMEDSRHPLYEKVVIYLKMLRQN